MISFATKQHFSEQDFFGLTILWWRNCEMDCVLWSVAIKYMKTAKQLLQLYIRIAKKNDALPYTKQHVNLRTWFLMLNIWKVWSVTFLVWKGNIKMTTYLCSIRWRHVTPGRQFWYLKPFSVFQAISSPSPFVWSALTIVSVDVGYKVPFDPNWTNQNLFEQKYRITNEETGHQPPLQLKLSLVHRKSAFINRSLWEKDFLRSINFMICPNQFQNFVSNIFRSLSQQWILEIECGIKVFCVCRLYKNRFDNWKPI